MTLNRHLLVRLVPVVVLPTLLLGTAGFLATRVFVARSAETAAEIQLLSAATSQSGSSLVKAFSEMQARQNEFSLRNASQLVEKEIEHLKDVLLALAREKEMAVFARSDEAMKSYLETVLKQKFQSQIERYAFSEIAVLDATGEELIRMTEYVVSEESNPISGGFFWGGEKAAPIPSLGDLEAVDPANPVSCFIDWSSPVPNQSLQEHIKLVVPLRFSGVNYSLTRGDRLGKVYASVPLERLLRMIPQEFLSDGVFGFRREGQTSDEIIVKSSDLKHHALSVKENLSGRSPLSIGGAELVLFLDRSEINASVSDVSKANLANLAGVSRVYTRFARFNDALFQALLVIAISMVILIGVAVIVVIKVARSIAHPIVELERESKMVQEGALVHSVGTASGVFELVNLARSLEKMRKRLLRELSGRDELVRQRTIELEESNLRLKDEVAERRLAEEAAKAGSRAKSAFVATISHEIRTPLNGVIGSIELLRRSGSMNKTQVELIETAESSADLLLGIVNDVLDYSKIEAGRLDLVPEPFTLVTLAEEMKRLFASRLDARNVRFHAHIDPSAQGYFYGDSMRIKQVLVNLLGNASKFTERGFVHFNGWYGNAHSDGAGRLHLAIADSGIGIPPERIEKLFDPFEQLDNTLTRRSGGTGLGLSICHRMVTLMDGSIEVKSEVGLGSCFEISVPLPRIEKPDMDPIELAPASSLSVRSFRVLLVEDNQVNQRIVVRMLEKMGHTTTVAGNGQDALDVLATEAFDVVLMDCQMPVMDGLTAARRIRAWPDDVPNAQVPIIALTANSSAEDRSEVLNVGMNEFLTKPVRMNTLGATIETVVGQNLQNRRFRASKPSSPESFQFVSGRQR